MRAITSVSIFDEKIVRTLANKSNHIAKRSSGAAGELIESLIVA
jgi:hypothetical protein